MGAVGRIGAVRSQLVTGLTTPNGGDKAVPYRRKNENENRDFDFFSPENSPYRAENENRFRFYSRTKTGSPQ